MNIRHKWEAGYLNSAYYKMDHIAHFFIGDLATSIQKTVLSNSTSELIVYGTTMGAIGGLLPIVSKEEVEFFVHLEMYMRQEAPSLLGRDHLSYRSAYLPVKDVIDGDLCEHFSFLSTDKQTELALALGYTSNEILKKLEELRMRLL